MYTITIKVGDSFCEYKYTLTGSDEYSIKNIVDVITENTNLIASEGEFVKGYGLDGILENTDQ